MKRQSDYSVRSILATPTKSFKQPSTVQSTPKNHPSNFTNKPIEETLPSQSYQPSKHYLNPYNTPLSNLGEDSILSKLQHTVVNRAPRESYFTHRPTFYSDSFRGPLADERDCPLVTLEHKELWNKFNSIGTEMVITKSGRWVSNFFSDFILSFFHIYFSQFLIFDQSSLKL